MIQELFTQVFSMSMTASVVIAIVLVLRVFLQKVPKVFTYILWSVVVFRLLCPFSFESSVGIFPSQNDAILNQTQEVSIPQMSIGEEVVMVHEDMVNPTVAIVGTEEKPILRVINVMEVATWIWVLGISCLIVNSLFTWFMLRNRLIGAVKIEEDVFVVDYIKTPFVLGIIKPKIYLPSGLSELQQELVIMHERIHIRRLDYLTRLLAFVALALHWFNPFVWVAFIISERDMELSCDEAAISKICKEKQLAYAETLFTIATGKRIFHVIPLAFGEGSPKARIKNIIHYKKPTVWILGSMIVVISIVGICLMSNQKSDTNENKVSDAYQIGKERLQEVCREYLGIDLNESEEQKIMDAIAEVETEIVEKEHQIEDVKSQIDMEETAVLEHSRVATNAQVENKSYLEAYDPVKVSVNKQLLDLTHDGIDDYVETVFYVPSGDMENIDLEQIDTNMLFEQGHSCYVQVYDGSDTENWDMLGTLLFEKFFHASHAGNAQLNVLSYEGEISLLSTNMYIGNAGYEFSYEAFYLESDGTQVDLEQNSLQIETSGDGLLEKDKDEIRGFEEDMQVWTRDANSVVITDVLLEEQIVSTQEHLYSSALYYNALFRYVLGERSGDLTVNTIESVLLDDKYEITLSVEPGELFQLEDLTYVAMICNASYQPKDGGMQQISIESGGTAYPVSYNKTELLAQSNYGYKVYGMLEDGTFGLKESVSMKKGAAGELMYEYTSEESVQEITQDEYLDKYKSIVNDDFMPVVFG